MYRRRRRADFGVAIRAKMFALGPLASLAVGLKADT